MWWGLKKGFVIFLYHRNEASSLKTVGISDKQNKAKIYFFFKILFPFALSIGIVRNWIFFSLLYTRRAFGNPTYWFQTLVHAQYLTAVFRLCGKTSLCVSVPGKLWLSLLPTPWQELWSLSLVIKQKKNQLLSSSSSFLSTKPNSQTPLSFENATIPALLAARGWYQKAIRLCATPYYPQHRKALSLLPSCSKWKSAER